MVDDKNAETKNLSIAVTLAGEQIKRSVLATGGGRSTTVARALLATAGQTAVGAGSSANYGLSYGFWQESKPAGCCIDRVGNANGIGTYPNEVTISDIQLLVTAKFISSLPCEQNLMCLTEADVNQSGGDNPKCSDITISDIQTLVNHLFIAGPANAPLRSCDQALLPPRIVPDERADISVQSRLDSGMTTINVTSPVILRALQLELTGPEGALPQNLLENRLDLFNGQTGSQVRIGILDIDGGQTIAAGTTAVLRIPGEYEIVSALVVDEQLQEIVPIINGAMHNAPLPATFAFAQNYPNPFNPVTEISFAVPVACDVRLEVFNVLGQKVATLVNGRFDAGEHSVTWDASAQSSGVYLYRITAGEVVETKKMMLLK